MSYLGHPLENHFDFIIILIFDNLNVIKEFAGEHYRKYYISQKIHICSFKIR